MSETTNTAPITPNALAAIGRGLPVMLNQSWSFSTSYMHAYVNTHLASCDGANENQVGLMAAARLEWLLRQTRMELSNKFTERDIATLMNCFQGDVFSPDQFYSLVSDVCADFGYDIDEIEDLDFGHFAQKLLALTAAQRLTLADALEQTWHIGMKEKNQSPAAYLSSIGIELL